MNHTRMHATSPPGLAIVARRWLQGLTAMATLMLAGCTTAPPAAHTTLQVYAAGSLRAALTEVAQAFERSQPGVRVQFSFGPSGLLRDRIVGGERADVFASANMAHPQALAAAGKAGAVQRFARNAMCALVAPSIDVTPATLVERMLDPAVKLGTSTPKADPSGDYAWMVFERIEQQGRSGAFKPLAAKALQLTGGPNSPPPPPGRSAYGELVAQGRADIFLTYCTNAAVAVAEHPQLRSVAVPATIDVRSDYGLTVIRGASTEAERFARFVLSDAGQAMLVRHGFLRAQP